MVADVGSLNGGVGVHRVHGATLALSVLKIPLQHVEIKNVKFNLKPDICTCVIRPLKDRDPSELQ